MNNSFYEGIKKLSSKHLPSSTSNKNTVYHGLQLEQLVQNCFKEAGAFIIEVEGGKGQKQRNVEAFNEAIENGDIDYESYVVVVQPNGSQAAPEFYLINRGKLLEFECKSSKDGKPAWNSSMPKEGCLYLLLNTSNKETLVLEGKSIIKDSERESLEAFHKAMMDVTKAFNSSSSNSNIKYRQRGAFDQVTNPFDLKDKNKLNKKAHNKLKEYFK